MEYFVECIYRAGTDQYNNQETFSNNGVRSRDRHKLDIYLPIIMRLSLSYSVKRSWDLCNSVCLTYAVWYPTNLKYVEVSRQDACNRNDY